MSNKDNEGKARRRVHSFWYWSERALFAVSILLLGYVALIALQAKLYELRARQYLDSAAIERPKTLKTSPWEAPPVASLPLEGDILGRLEISRLGVSAAVLQGTKSRTLRLGVGHIEGTALPGEPGNSAIAGHRDTFFRALKDVRPQDEILLQTARGLSRYQVDWARVVRPNDMSVLESSTESSLTLVTCYPFHYLGPAPDRYVIRAHLDRLAASR